MGWEVFDGARRGYNPKISIRSTGAIAFNAGAIRDLNIDQDTIAQLLFDRENSKIGIKLGKTGEFNNMFNVSIRKDRSAWVSAKSFFKYYKIELPKPGKSNAWRFDLKQEENVIVLDLALKQDDID